MGRVLAWLRRACDIIDRVSSWVLIAYMGTNTALIIIVILYRMTGRGVSWSEELSRWLLVGICFLGSSVAMNRGAHIGVTAAVDISPNILKRVLVFLANAAVMLFLIYFIRYGYGTAMASRRSVGAVIKVPMMWPYLQMVVGGILMAIQLIPNLIGPFLPDEDIDRSMLTRMTEEEIHL